MSFGNTTINFMKMVKTGDPDPDGIYQMEEAATPAPGCRHRPLTFRETAELDVDIATEMWRSTLPLHEYPAELITAISAAKPNDSIMVDGVRYQIIGGVRPFGDMASVPFKMSIISKLQIG